MSEESAELAIALHHDHRMLGAGIPLYDLEQLRSSAPGTWLDWYAHWMARTAVYEAAAQEAAAGHFLRTAGEHFVRAALCAHFAQFMLYSHEAEKRQAQQVKVDLYRSALPYLQPPAVAVSVQADDLSVPVILRVPDSGRPAPCVLLVPGLEATKEEMHGWLSYFHDRSIATATFDGPGQGELAGVALTPERYVTATSAVLDAVAKHDGINGAAVGILGVSLGGLLASMVAARDHRVAAAAEVGGTFDTESRWERANRLSRLGHQHITQSATEEETRRRIGTWTMRGLASEIRCPFLVVHGEKDRIVPVDQAEAFRDQVPHAELVVVPDGNHVCHNLAHLVRPRIADWFSRFLLEVP